jgi:hypothetical protein
MRSRSGSVYRSGMGTGEPWADYSRHRLPPGWTYPPGRDVIRQALASQQAHLNKLSLVWLGSKTTEPVYLLIADWFSDARANYFGLRDPHRIPLRIMHHAVPAPLGRQIAGELKFTWLDRAAAWARAAMR